MWWKKYFMNRFIKIAWNKEMLLLMSLLFFFSSVMAQKTTGTQDPLWDEAISIHEEALVVDAHAHQLVFGLEDRKAYHPEATQLDISMAKEGGLNAIALHFAYYPIENGTLYQQVKKDMEILQERIAKSEEKVMIAQNLSKAESKLVLLPGVEYFFGAFKREISTLDSLYDIGVRTITLMNNKFDVLTRSSGKDKADLNAFGLALVKKMNRKGMLIDISHLDDPTQMAIIQASDKPVVASHSPVRGAHDVPRNISDKALTAMAQKGGAVMITFNSGNLAGVEEGRCSIEKLIDHIDYAVNLVGLEHVGIGSDFNGAGLRSPKGLENASGFPLITYHLLKRGYSREEIFKIMGGNYQRILNKVLVL